MKPFGRLFLTIFLPVFLFFNTGFAVAASKVEILHWGDDWSIEVDGQPFELKGAGMGYSDEAGIAILAKAGGNAFRTWGTEHLDVQLAAAERHGLKVLVGLDMQKQLQGFDYNDSAAVAAQLAMLKASIDRYKSHPSLLGWIIANEPNLMIGADGGAVQPNPKVYAAMGDVLDYIHEHDPDHPATVAFAFTGTLADDVNLALKSMPTLDFLSFQAYGALPAIAPLVEELAVELPYMVTEFGPLGHWEMPATQWGREIEEASGAKAAGLVDRMYQAGLNNPEGQLLGGFAFLWGHKQERTPTWYGLFTEDGGRTAAVDELTRLWTGQYSEQRAPSAWGLRLNELQATENIVLAPGESVHARLQASDPEGDSLSIRWQLMHEVQARSHGGHFEAEPDAVRLDAGKTTSVGDVHEMMLRAPLQPGEYRLYAWAQDGSGGVATANFPFLVAAP
ncbi:hypothetical protein [Granulosicoccus antarcticus]|uniref:hypothetical protein n=1 Tax=Granulosicoccus antarcticus TaxID=437505 RepID=UPI00146FB609|nr:hypothetical protein [Granulosicoccus antarcticus]